MRTLWRRLRRSMGFRNQSGAIPVISKYFMEDFKKIGTIKITKALLNTISEVQYHVNDINWCYD